MNEKQQNVLKWLASGFISISALLVSFMVEWSLQWWTFTGFLIGHIIWSFFAYKMKEWSLFGLNFFFIFVDIYAMFARL